MQRTTHMKHSPSAINNTNQSILLIAIYVPNYTTHKQVLGKIFSCKDNQTATDACTVLYNVFSSYYRFVHELS